MKKILITGIFGQDGQILKKKLSKKYKILGQFYKDNKKLRIKNVLYKKINLKNFSQVKNYISIFKPNYIIHLASKNNSYSEKNNQIKKIDYTYNLNITKNLINSILKLKKKPVFIFAGSSQMYGDYKKKVNEKNIFKPNSYYGKYKVDSHNYLMKIKRRCKLKATTTILFNHDSAQRNKTFLLPKIIRYLKSRKKGKLQKIYDLNIKGDFSHSENICSGIILIMNNKLNLDKIILSSNKYTKINDVINFLIRKNKLNIKLISKKKNTNTKLLGDNTLAKKIIKWKYYKNYFSAATEMYQFN
jgi:GDP-D-mannose dehydratase